MLRWKTEGTRLYRGLRRAARLAAAGSSRSARSRRPPEQRASYQTWHETGQAAPADGEQGMRLQSYAQGQWVTGTGRPTELLHAVTGEKVAEATSEGLDFKGMLEYGRRVGGPKLRAMTFHQRARMLKAMAQHLMAGKEELYQVSAGTGATKADSWIDVEGGIGTFFAYGGEPRVPHGTLRRRIS